MILTWIFCLPFSRASLRSQQKMSIFLPFTEPPVSAASFRSTRPSWYLTSITLPNGITDGSTAITCSDTFNPLAVVNPFPTPPAGVYQVAVKFIQDPSFFAERAISWE